MKVTIRHRWEESERANPFHYALWGAFFAAGFWAGYLIGCP